MGTDADRVLALNQCTTVRAHGEVGRARLHSTGGIDADDDAESGSDVAHLNRSLHPVDAVFRPRRWSACVYPVSLPARREQQSRLQCACAPAGLPTRQPHPHERQALPRPAHAALVNQNSCPTRLVPGRCLGRTTSNWWKRCDATRRCGGVRGTPPTALVGRPHAARPRASGRRRSRTCACLAKSGHAECRVGSRVEHVQTEGAGRV